MPEMTVSGNKKRDIYYSSYLSTCIERDVSELSGLQLRFAIFNGSFVSRYVQKDKKCLFVLTVKHPSNIILKAAQGRIIFRSVYEKFYLQ